MRERLPAGEFDGVDGPVSGPSLSNELSVEEIKRRTGRSIGVLLLREASVRAMNVAGGVALARILAPEVFGIFAVASFVVGFFALFRDIGLGAAVVQKRGGLSEEDLRTVFTLQQGGATLLGLAAMAAAPAAAAMYGLDNATIWLIRALALAFLLSSLGTVPSVLLERRLAFDRLVAVELAGTAVYYVAAVLLAHGGMGVWSLVAAVLARSVVSVTALYVANPWRPRIGVSRRAAAEMLRFGLPFQVSLVVHFVKDNVAPTLVAMLAGAGAVGYVNWAASVAFLPLLFVGIAGRVTFPTYSRLQHDRRLLQSAIEKSIRLVCLGVFPSTFLIVALAPQIVDHVYTAKWAPALPALYLFSIATLGAGITTTASNAIYAMGKATTMLRLVCLYALLSWAASLLLVPTLQFTGYALANAIVACTAGFFLPLRELKKIVDVRVFSGLWCPLVASMVAGMSAYLAAGALVKDLPSLLVVGFAGGLVYLAVLLVLEGRRLKAEIREVVAVALHG